MDVRGHSVPYVNLSAGIVMLLEFTYFRRLHALQLSCGLSRRLGGMIDADALSDMASDGERTHSKCVLEVSESKYVCHLWYSELRRKEHSKVVRTSAGIPKPNKVSAAHITTTTSFKPQPCSLQLTS
jgi:hypothetical protein